MRKVLVYIDLFRRGLSEINSSPSQRGILGILQTSKIPEDKLSLTEADLILGQVQCSTDQDLIELLLTTSPTDARSKSAATALLSEFGSLEGVLDAPNQRLRKVSGITSEMIARLRLANTISVRRARRSLECKTLLTSYEEVADYCAVAMRHLPTEQFRVLFLDTRLQLISDEVLAMGTVDFVPVSPREVVRRALELNATAVILAHNHPSGDPEPSTSDIQMTEQIHDAVSLFSIKILDHLIVGKQFVYSFSAAGLL